MKNIDILKIFTYLIGANTNVIVFVFAARYAEGRLHELYPNSELWKPIIWSVCVIASGAGYFSLWKMIKKMQPPPSS